MSDFGEAPRLDQETIVSVEHSLTPEQEDKMVMDVATLAKIHRYAQQHNYHFALSGGYAVDATCGGEISRFHGDMDGVLYVPGEVPQTTIKENLEEQLLPEITPWKLAKEEDSFLEYREDDESKDWEMRRRLELDIFEPYPEMALAPRTLTDGDGNEYHFEVLPVDALLAAKVLSTVRLAGMTQEERERVGLRDMKPSDKTDFLRLLEHAEFDEERTKAALVSAIRFTSDDELSDDQAKLLAEEQWNKAIAIYR